MNTTCVYCHIRLDKNEIFYIGIGNNKRPYSNLNRNQHWKNVVNKNPDYKVEILFKNISWEEACEKEIELIKMYGRKDLGLGVLCNLSDGGDGNKNYIFTEQDKKNISLGVKNSSTKRNLGKKHTEETKKLMSLKHLGNSYGLGYKHTEEAKFKMSQRIGEKNSFFNKTHTDEVKEKISQASRKKVFTEEYRKKFSDEHKRKLSENHHSKKVK